MDTGLFDVLHHSTDVDLGSVAQCVDVDLDGVLEKPVDQNRMVGRELSGAGDVAVQGLFVIDDLHPPAAEHVTRPHQDRIADRCGDLPGLLETGRGTELGRRQPGVQEHLAKPATVFSEVDGLGPGADNRHTGIGKPLGEPQRSLSTELDDHPDNAGTACAGTGFGMKNL